jgi:hypothetical protein
MRVAIALPLLLLAACNVTKDDQNGATTLSIDHSEAENTLDAAGDTAQNIGGTIVNDVQDTAAQVDNQVDVDVDVNRDGTASANANAN